MHYYKGVRFVKESIFKRTGDNKNAVNIPTNKNKPNDLTGINPLKAKVPKDNAVVIIDKNIARNVTSFSALLFEKNMQ